MVSPALAAPRKNDLHAPLALVVGTERYRLPRRVRGDATGKELHSVGEGHPAASSISSLQALHNLYLHTTFPFVSMTVWDGQCPLSKRLGLLCRLVLRSRSRETVGMVGL